MRLPKKQRTVLTRRELFHNYRSETANPIATSAAQPVRGAIPFVDETHVTPNADFFVPLGHEVPVIQAEDWRLQVGGLVEQPFALTIEDLKVMPFASRIATIANVKSRPDQFLMGHAVWRGVPFMALVEQAAVDIDTAYAGFRSMNGYSTYLPVELLKDALLATDMNGEVLSPQQGYPVRLIIPGVYDYKMPKWLVNIEFTAVRPAGYFESRGWSATGEVQTTSAIFSPRVREQVAGVVTFSGMAFGGNREISQIELSIDDGEWMPVPFAASERGSWTRWQIDWMPPAPGDYAVRVRATDETDFTQQTVNNTAIFPNGSSAIHSIVFRVVS